MGERLGGNDGVYGMLIRAYLGMVALAEGEVARADSLVETAAAMAREDLREDHRYALDIRRMQARVSLAKGDAPAALARLGPVAEAEARIRPSPHPRRGETELLKGLALLDMGDRDAAVRAFAEAERQFTELPRGHPLRGRLAAAVDRAS
jgi:tetratricopeptide (TPR) repeat protein